MKHNETYKNKFIKLQEKIENIKHGVLKFVNFSITRTPKYPYLVVCLCA